MRYKNFNGNFESLAGVVKVVGPSFPTLKHFTTLLLRYATKLCVRDPVAAYYVRAVCSGIGEPVPLSKDSRFTSTTISC
jgi:hypothetical protein